MPGSTGGKNRLRQPEHDLFKGPRRHSGHYGKYRAIAPVYIQLANSSGARENPGHSTTSPS
ncbi:hypothetical protein MES5069_70381 [Mesorhizobium escarrei]|uniref:Uncharacterized protein n=1 Tax=Mesorhizobium escarrei TaxID=666018 RepID=A0ABM9EHB5_9HYPH|nr:hypothetical protein MES5069_70381 [Mesorhizobium escarrei]